MPAKRVEMQWCAIVNCCRQRKSNQKALLSCAASKKPAASNQKKIGSPQKDGRDCQHTSFDTSHQATAQSGYSENSQMENMGPEIWQLFAPLDIARWSVKRKPFNFRRDTEQSHLLYPLGNEPGSKSRTKCRRDGHLLERRHIQNVRRLADSQSRSIELIS